MNCRKHIESIISGQAAKEGLVVVDFDSNQSRDHFISQLRKQISLALSEKPGDHEYFYKLIEFLDSFLDIDTQWLLTNEMQHWFKQAYEIIKNKDFNPKNNKQLVATCYALMKMGRKLEVFSSILTREKVISMIKFMNEIEPTDKIDELSILAVKDYLFNFYSQHANLYDWESLIKTMDDVVSKRQLSLAERRTFLGYNSPEICFKRALMTNPKIMGFLLNRKRVYPLDDEILAIASLTDDYQDKDFDRAFANNLTRLKDILAEGNIRKETQDALKQAITTFENTHKITKMKI